MQNFRKNWAVLDIQRRTHRPTTRWLLRTTLGKPGSKMIIWRDSCCIWVFHAILTTGPSLVGAKNHERLKMYWKVKDVLTPLYQPSSFKKKNILANQILDKYSNQIYDYPYLACIKIIYINSNTTRQVYYGPRVVKFISAKRKNFLVNKNK